VAVDQAAYVAECVKSLDENGRTLVLGVITEHRSQLEESLARYPVEFTMPRVPFRIVFTGKSDLCRLFDLLSATLEIPSSMMAL